MKPQSQDVLITSLREHTIEFSEWFNESSTKEGLGVLLDPADELKRIGRLRDDNLSWRVHSLSQHRVSKEQVQTAVRAFAQSIANPGNLGFVIGCPPSEKSSMALMMMFALPVLHLRTKIAYIPLYMTSNRNSEQVRMLVAMSRFINLYGDINIVSASRLSGCADRDLESGADADRALEPDDMTLWGYTYLNAEDRYPGGDRAGSFMESAIVKMRPGKIAMDVSAFCDRAKQRGHEVMLIVEEARPPVIDADGKPERKMPCPLSRALTELGEGFLSPDNKSFMVGFAEKPMAAIPVGNSWAVNMEPVSDKISTQAQPA